MSDDQNVVEEAVAHPLPTGSTTVFDRCPDPVPNGAVPYDRLDGHCTPRPGQMERLADLLLGPVADVLAAPPGAIAAREHAPAEHDDSTPNPPAPDMAHSVVAERSDWSDRRARSPRRSGPRSPDTVARAMSLRREGDRCQGRSRRVRT